MTHFPSTVRVDGRDLKLLIARLTIEQAVPFRVRFNQIAQRSARTDAMKSSALQSDDDPAIAKALDRELAEETEAARFLAATVRDFVSVDPSDDLAMAEGIQTGAQLLEWIGPRSSIAGLLASTVYLENTLSTAGKELWKSRRASDSSSGAPTPAPSGETPATTASPAPPAATTANAAAPASSPSGSSGAPVH